MKKNAFVICCCILFSFAVAAQSYVSSSFVSSASGRNILLSYTHTLGEKNEIGGGLKIHINNTRNPDDLGNVYYRRMYAQNFLQFFGLHAYYHRTLFGKDENLAFFAFYHTQLSYGQTKELIVYGGETPDICFGPFAWWEHAVGLGFRTHLIGKMFLFGKAGLDMDLIFDGYDNVQKPHRPVWELGYFLNAGLELRL